MGNITWSAIDTSAGIEKKMKALFVLLLSVLHSSQPQHFPPLPRSQSFTRPWPGGAFPNVDDCHSYWRCNEHGEPMAMKCHPPNLNFNPPREVCDDQATEYDCKVTPITPTPRDITTAARTTPIRKTTPRPTTAKTTVITTIATTSTTTIPTTSTTTIPTTTKTLPSVCRNPGWISLESSCYLSSEDKMTWADARKFCELKGEGRGYLVEIESAEEQKRIEVILSRTTFYWLGLTYQAKEGTFVWQHSQMPLEWSNWQPNQPDHANTTEHCVEMNIKDGKWGWNDLDCSNDHYPTYAFCEAN